MTVGSRVEQRVCDSCPGTEGLGRFGDQRSGSVTFLVHHQFAVSSSMVWFWPDRSVVGRLEPLGNHNLTFWDVQP